MGRSPRVFVSYSHDSEEHRERVLELSERLRGDGIDCHVDRYEQAPVGGWPRWMQDEIEKADFVLVVGSRNYAERFRGKAPRGKGKGAKWEGAIITQQLYDDESDNRKFVPVLLEAADEAHVPGPLRGTTYYRLDAPGGYDELYRRLTAQPEVVPAPMGELRALPQRRGRARRGETAGAVPGAARAERAPGPAARAERAPEPVAPAGRTPGRGLDRSALLALLESAEALNQTDTLAVVLTRILELAGKLLDAEAGSVILHDPEKDDLYFAAATGPKRHEVMPIRTKRGKGKSGKVFDTGAPILENTVVGHNAQVDRQTGFQTQSILCIPLEHRGRRFGVMQMLNKAGGKGHYTVDDLELLGRFGVQASIAIQRATLFEQMLGTSGLFAAPEVREELIGMFTDPEGAVRQERVSVLAADMRHFTDLCHRIGRPEKIRRVLGDYVSAMAQTIAARRGIVNKVVGDGIFAFFRGPDAPRDAVEAAFDACARFDALLAVWRKESRVELDFLDLGVGVSTDEEAILGTVGSARFRDFTIIGEGINLATALGKHGRAPLRVMVDQPTWSAVKGAAGLRAEGPTPFKTKPGQSGPSYPVYALTRA